MEWDYIGIGGDEKMRFFCKVAGLRLKEMKRHGGLTARPEVGREFAGWGWVAWDDAEGGGLRGVKVRCRRGRKQMRLVEDPCRLEGKNKTTEAGDLCWGGEFFFFACGLDVGLWRAGDGECEVEAEVFSLCIVGGQKEGVWTGQACPNVCAAQMRDCFCYWTLAWGDDAPRLWIHAQPKGGRQTGVKGAPGASCGF